LDQTIVSLTSAVYVKNTAAIVASYVAKHEVATSALPDVIRNVFDTLKSLEADERITTEEDIPSTPTSDIEPTKSVFPDHLVCLEDGERHKMLKRHLWTRYRMTPDEYREKWGLPDDYPMIAPNYARLRSNLARKSGLGR
jgi:predicted transcriptional regulator